MGTPQDERFKLLRQKAEEALQGTLVNLDGLPLEDIHILMHELQVHQVELTMQNEELRRIHLELETSRDQYADLYNFAPVGYCTLSNKDRILEANKTLADLIGIPQEKLINTNLSEFVYKHDQDKYYLHRLQAFKDGSHVSDIWMTRRTGERVYIHLESKLDHTDKTKLRVMLIDITERKNTEEALRESEARFRSVLESSLDIAYQRNQKTNRYDYISPVVEQMLGFNEEEMTAMRTDDVLARIHPEERETIASLLTHVNQIGWAKMEYRFMHKDGQYRWLADYVTVIKDLDGQPLYLSGIVRDITEIKEAENELRSLNQELEERVAFKTDEVLELQRRLMAGIEAERAQLAREIHDGPIQDIYAIIYRVAGIEPISQSDKYQEELRSIMGEIVLVNQTLRAISQELLPPTLSQFGLKKAIQGHAGNIEQTYPNLNIQLDLYDDGNSIEESVRLALFRIYQTSIMNVIRHANANQVNIRFYRETEICCLEIQDDGIGFVVPKGWIEFAREGHLGLASIHERAKSLNGRMELNSQPGRGTLIRVAVPV